MVRKCPRENKKRNVKNQNSQKKVVKNGFVVIEVISVYGYEEVEVQETEGGIMDVLRGKTFTSISMVAH